MLIRSREAKSDVYDEMHDFFMNSSWERDGMSLSITGANSQYVLIGNFLSILRFSKQYNYIVTNYVIDNCIFILFWAEVNFLFCDLGATTVGEREER